MLNKTEEKIFNQVITWVKGNPSKTIPEIIDKTTERIKKSDYLKEDWQIHYAEERIVNLIKKELGIDFEYAGFWKRFVAFIIDTIITAVGGFIIGYIFGFVLGIVLVVGGAEDISAFRDMGGVLGGIIGVIAAWLYFAIMESSSTQGTLGKMALGIKVTDMDGNRVSFGRATGRHFAKILSFLILYIGFIMIAFTEKRQGLHDMIAETIVVKK
ncbi:RDD family protein [Candidatus Falkowbacteria bacterium]|nr:RDD family protein [Candidatus Falkowbacteria bacterium]